MSPNSGKGAWSPPHRRPLAGELRVPGDKSVSHRALIFGALAEGTTSIRGLSDGEDVQSTRRCLEQLGAHIEDCGELVKTPAGESWSEIRVHGAGASGLKSSKRTLDCGNSGTTIRLLMGVLSGHPFPSRLTGDASLRRRPMKRVADPLRSMGAKIELADGEHAPVKIEGGALRGVAYESPVASAQLKSAVLLAGLRAQGETSVLEPAPSRDHTERMLRHFGLKVGTEGHRVWIYGGAPLKAAPVRVPGDVSSAAFWLVAACVVPGSRLKLSGVCTNPTRSGVIDALARMGAKLDLLQAAVGPGEEPVADITAAHSQLVATEVTPQEFPKLVDEAPILAVAATQARGTTRIRGAAELRVKESDRMEGTVKMLAAFGAEARVEGDDLIVPGPQALKGGTIDPKADHRIAMAAAVASLIADGPSTVLDPGCAQISYPAFFPTLDGLLQG
ncbi:MAG: 3-phosphoshikimate 1-carboxyvinyltransferase [Elusimicrobia bacterium]|nr:3-phosphoshikimate 1-carboxyvinyltransferase [Elusimicrobiota bacterium]